MVRELAVRSVGPPSVGFRRARPRGAGRVAALVAPGVLAWLAGCGAEEPAPPPAPAQSDAGAISPAEMRMILEGLQSNRVRTQYAALETLSRFPAVVQAHRDLVERLHREGGSPQVRARAAELLAASPAPP